MSSFGVNYTAGGTLDVVKKVLNIGNIDNVDKLKLVDKIVNLETVDTINLINKLKSIDEIDKINLIKEISNLKTVEEVKEVGLVKEVGHIKGFPTLLKPYNYMIQKTIPAIADDFVVEYVTPNYPVEVLAITVTCTGYGEQDNYDLYCGEEKWFENWYCSEVKEGLFLGTSNIVYYTPPNTKFKIVFKNKSATSKTIFFGFRMLK